MTGALLTGKLVRACSRLLLLSNTLPSLSWQSSLARRSLPLGHVSPHVAALERLVLARNLRLGILHVARMALAAPGCWGAGGWPQGAASHTASRQLLLLCLPLLPGPACTHAMSLLQPCPDRAGAPAQHSRRGRPRPGLEGQHIGAHLREGRPGEPAPSGSESANTC